jgi:outer membrane biosynthesis protein TonB
MKFIIILMVILWGMLSWFSSSVGLKAEENDTAYSTNILPNAGVTSSSQDNFNLDGVSTSAASLTNNSTHQGFTITCETEINNACGAAFNGELESSRDMKVSASGSLFNISGTDDAGTSYVSSEAKNNGGVQLTSNHSFQNCESSASSFACGSRTGQMDSMILTQSIKDKDGNVLATMTTTRVDDAGYNSNSVKRTDNLVYNGLGAYSYEWSWQGNDVEHSTSALRGPNLLGAEVVFEYPTDDYEALTTTEQQNINEALGTTNLTESEIWDVISGIEESIAMKIYESGVPKNTMIEVEINEKLEVVKVNSSSQITEVVKEVIEEVKKKETIQTIKKEVVSIITAKKSKPATLAKAIIEETKQEAKEVKKEAKKKIKKETVKEEKTETKKENTKVAKLEASMDKVDAVVKDAAKNLEVKSIIKLDAMQSDSDINLAAYNNQEFYKSKDIYLNQVVMFDNRAIYDNISLASYTNNDPINIKDNILRKINNQKQKLLNEIEVLKNG